MKIENSELFLDFDEIKDVNISDSIVAKCLLLNQYINDDKFGLVEDVLESIIEESENDDNEKDDKV